VGTTFVTGTANAVLIQWRVVMLSVFHKLSSVPNTPRSLEFPRLFIGRSSPFFAVSGLSEIRRFRRLGSSLLKYQFAGNSCSDGTAHGWGENGNSVGAAGQLPNGEFVLGLPHDWLADGPECSILQHLT